MACRSPTFKEIISWGCYSHHSFQYGHHRNIHNGQRNWQGKLDLCPTRLWLEYFYAFQKSTSLVHGSHNAAQKTIRYSFSVIQMPSRGVDWGTSLPTLFSLILLTLIFLLYYQAQNVDSYTQALHCWRMERICLRKSWYSTGRLDWIITMNIFYDILFSTFLFTIIGSEYQHMTIIIFLTVI